MSSVRSTAGVHDASGEKYEPEFIFVFMHRRLIVTGFVIWAVATLALRLWGHYLLHPPGLASTIVMFAVAFFAMALVTRRICQGSGLPRDQWLAGAVSLASPTLILDPFSSAFFTTVFPNIAPQAAGLFGGLMLCCCAGALAGTIDRW
jgi:Family of unknown function (DUF5367)